MLEDDVPQKKKKIKYNNSKANKRVIKFTSGEPYLEYLPNMLNKETHKVNYSDNSAYKKIPANQLQERVLDFRRETSPEESKKDKKVT